MMATPNTKRDEKQSKKRVLSKNKLIFGWGVNDVDYEVQKYNKASDNKWARIWTCPYYVKWYSILRRAKSAVYKRRQPTYQDVTVSEDWKYLSNFIKWVDEQPNRDWMNCEPDKDILSRGNKHYSQLTTVFVGRLVNSFTKDRGNDRGTTLLGTCIRRKGNMLRYQSYCSDPFKINNYHLGYFSTELEAHKAWQAKKHEYACHLADLQDDPRVADALRQRYLPETDWTKQ